MTEKVLVTGGAGFIGSSLVRALLDRGDEVTVLDDLSTGRRENLRGLDVRLLEASVLDEAALRDAVAGAHFVFHQAGQVSVPASIADPVRNDAVNVRGTLLVLEAARRAGVERVVHASSCAVYGDEPGLPKSEASPLAPMSPYAASKLASEAYVRAFSRSLGPPGVALRYFNVFGPRQPPDGGYAAVVPAFAAALRDGRPLVVYGDGLQTRDFVPVETVVEANLRAAEATDAAGLALNVGLGRSTSVLALAEAMAAAAGRPLRIEHRPAREGEIRHSTADVSLARRVLGFAPPEDLDGALRKTVAWYLEEAT